MNAQAPIPLRPDMGALMRNERRSLIRALTAATLSTRQGTRPESILKAFDDARAEKILKAATNVSSTSSASALGLTSTTVLPLLAPASASGRLFAMAHPLDLTGLASIKVPWIGASGRPSVPFVAEGSPAPVVNLLLSSVLLGPTKKLLVLAALTREMANASPTNAEAIIGNALTAATAQSLDAVLFGSAASSALAPAGILNGVAPIASAGTTGAAGIADDLGLIAERIAVNGINPDAMVIITTPSLAVKIRVLSSPNFQNVVLSSAALAAGTVIGVVPAGLATGYDGGVSIETSNESAVHFEDTAPLAIVDGSGALAAPVRSAFQTDVTVLKIRGNCAWAVHPGAVAQIEGAAW